MKTFMLLLCLYSLNGYSVLCERNDINHMMYETFKSTTMCFRILNGTNQFGCSTTKSGSNGVIHYVTAESDVDWLLTSSKAGPYVVVIPLKLFVKEVMTRLVEAGAGRVSGVLVAANGTDTDRPDHLSPDDTCPNRWASLDGTCDGGDTQWNPFGYGFLQRDWPFALFITRDSHTLQQINDCFVQFNLPLDESQTERPLCSLQMKAHMYAAVDTPTCLRRNSLSSSFSPINYCDPMGDQNLVHELFPRERFAAAPNGSVVLVTARLDAAAIFDETAPGAMTTVTGLVTLLTSARLLSQLLPHYKDTYKRNVVFALLNGEAQEYIGSSRVVYDMQRGQWPAEERPMRLEHLDRVIDLHQLGPAPALHAHCFNTLDAQSTVDSLVELCRQFGVTVEGSCTAARMPPSSLHSFLKANRSLPALLLSNHKDQYTNMYYNGLLDDGVNVAFHYANGSAVAADSLQAGLAKTAHGLTLTLARLVDPTITWPVNISVQATATMMDELLHCYLESRACPLFTEVYGGPVGVEGEGPLPLYVGVNRSNNRHTLVTLLTLANMTGTPLNLTADQCSSQCPADNSSDYYSCYWLGGVAKKGVCVGTRITRTPAVSPAFIIDNYNWTSGEYSTWSESVWQDVVLRMFLRPPFNQELIALVSGIVVLVLSFASVYWVTRNSDNLFNPATCERC